ncbi:hypothetical protein DL93DRAFT_2070488 [Clavulina sp. PMI_390]|nr:hypothetical protein DL93DRAFT_2070488 [Clavulina sp. PMI_390]
MTGRRAAPPRSPARYANLTPSRSETKALPTTPQQSRPPPTFPDPRNAPPPPGRRTTTYLKAKALAALPFQSSNMAGRGAHQIPSPNYAASVASFDSGSTAV